MRRLNWLCFVVSLVLTGYAAYLYLQYELSFFQYFIYFFTFLVVLHFVSLIGNCCVQGDIEERIKLRDQGLSLSRISIGQPVIAGTLYFMFFALCFLVYLIIYLYSNFEDLFGYDLLEQFLSSEETVETDEVAVTSETDSVVDESGLAAWLENAISVDKHVMIIMGIMLVEIFCLPLNICFASKVITGGKLY